MVYEVAIPREKQATMPRPEGKHLKSFKRLYSALLPQGGNIHPTTEIKISREDG